MMTLSKNSSEITELYYQRKILTDRETGRPRGLGFIEFSTRGEAQAVLDDAANLNLDGRLIEASFSDQKKERPQGGFQGGRGGYQNGGGRSNFGGDKFTAFVGNLGFKSTDSSVRNFFAGCGNVVDVRIAKNEEGQSKGFAHVDFDSADAVQKAKALAGQSLDGREIRVDESTPRQGGGNRGGRGGDRGGRGRGRGGFDPKKSGGMSVANRNAVQTFDDDE